MLISTAFHVFLKRRAVPEIDYSTAMIVNKCFCSVVNIMDLTDQEIQEICLIKEQHWPHSLPEQKRWWYENSNPTDFIIRLYDNKCLQAFLRLRRYQLLCGGKVYLCKCATEVSVDKKFFRRGLGRRLLSETMSVIDREEVSIGFLLCTSAQEHFYQKCRWVQIFDIKVRKSQSKEYSALDIDQRGFVYDPLKIICGPVLITGTVF